MLTHAATWMNLEDIMPHEISPSQKHKYCTTAMYVVPRVVKFIVTESRVVTAKGWEKDRWGVID